MTLESTAIWLNRVEFDVQCQYADIMRRYQVTPGTHYELTVLITIDIAAMMRGSTS